MNRSLTGILLVLVSLACAENQTEEHSDHQPPPAAPTSTAPAPAADASAAPTGEAVTFDAAEGRASGYMAAPDPPPSGTQRPGLIVIHEWWGLDQWTKDNVERFASLGYVAVAPDLYRGKSTTDPTEAHELMRGLPEDRALADLKAAWAWLASRDDVDSGRIGVIGWCMGGGYALTLAAEEPRLGAAVTAYGRLIEDRTRLSGILAPVLGIFAAEDRGIPVEDVRAFEATMKDLGKPVTIRVYEGTGHAFMNPHNEAGHNPGATTHAWQLIDGFLATHLRPGS